MSLGGGEARREQARRVAPVLAWRVRCHVLPDELGFNKLGNHDKIVDNCMVIHNCVSRDVIYV